MRGGLRRRLVITITIVSACALTLIVGGFNLALRSSLNRDANSLLRARAQAALAGLNVEETGVKTGETTDAGAQYAQVWVYSGARNIERPITGAPLDALAGRLRRKGSGTVEDRKTDTRLYAVPIRSGSQTVGTIVAAITLEPYEQTAKRALIGSVALGFLVFVLIVFSTGILIKRSLKPVADMTNAVADWSVHDLDRRFDTGPPTDELTNLAATFDGMLDRMSAMVRHERNFSAEMSHELRTPLASIAGETELALRRHRSASEYRTSLERIAARSDELNGIVETLLDAARAEAGSGLGDSCDLGATLLDAVGSARELSESLGVEIKLTKRSAEIRVLGSNRSLRRILAPLLENAAVYARSAVTINSDSEGGFAVVTVSDDGPGFQPGDEELVFQPGKRGQAKRHPDAPEGAGLGLSLARRLARTLGGELTIGPAPSGGAQVQVHLRLEEEPS